MRAIDADALMKKLGIGKDCNVCEQDDTPYCRWTPNVVDVCEAICDAPTIEPERKTGKWIYVERREPQYDIEGVKTWSVAYRCSNCRFIHSVIENFGQYSFCPNCGADMRGEEE